MRLSAYRALHTLFKQHQQVTITHERLTVLLQALRETDWARVMLDQEPSAVYDEDDDVFPLEPMTSQDTNQIDCPF